MLLYLHNRASTQVEDKSVDQQVAAAGIYRQLSQEVTKLVLEKLQTQDEWVLTRLTTFITSLCINNSTRTNVTKSVRFSEGDCTDTIVTEQVKDESVDLDLVHRSSSYLLIQDENAALWHLLCESCWMTFHQAHEFSSSHGLKYFSKIFELFISDHLLAVLLERSGYSQIKDDCSEHLGMRFLHKMVLPLVSVWHQSTDGEDDAAALFTVLWAVFRYIPQDYRVKALNDMMMTLTFQNAVFVKFCCKLISSGLHDPAVVRWVHEDEFGLFIISLTKGLCQRVLGTEVGVNLDHDKQELLCACLTSGWIINNILVHIFYDIYVWIIPA